MVAGIIGIIVVFLSAAGGIVGQLRSSNKTLLDIGYLGLFVMSIFMVAWSIVGFTIRARVDEECQKSPLGRVVLIWALLKIVVYILAGCAGFISLCCPFLTEENE